MRHEWLDSLYFKWWTPGFGNNCSSSIHHTKADKAVLICSVCVFVCLCVTVLPDSPNFPYRRYDRLPPISQFSIESDSDLSETAELIEEYEVFDPSRPRPKVILVIGKGAVHQTHTHSNCEYMCSYNAGQLILQFVGYHVKIMHILSFHLAN